MDEINQDSLNEAFSGFAEDEVKNLGKTGAPIDSKKYAAFRGRFVNFTKKLVDTNHDNNLTSHELASFYKKGLEVVKGLKDSNGDGTIDNAEIKTSVAELIDKGLLPENARYIQPDVFKELINDVQQLNLARNELLAQPDRVISNDLQGELEKAATRAVNKHQQETVNIESPPTKENIRDVSLALKQSGIIDSSSSFGGQIISPKQLNSTHMISDNTVRGFA